jgi:hypothetical protein
MLRSFGRAERHLGRPQIIKRPLNTVGDPLGDELLVVVERLLELKAILPHGARGRVRVRGRDQHVRRRDFESLLDQLAGLVADQAMDAKQIADHQGQPRLAVVED